MTTTAELDYAARQLAQAGNRTCGHDGARRYMNGSACPDCTPAKLAGHPEPKPTCAKPLRCYRACCVHELPVSTARDVAPPPRRYVSPVERENRYQ